MSTSLSMVAAVPRVAPNPWHAFGGIWRLAARRFSARSYWVVVGGLLLLFGLLMASIVRGGERTEQFFEWAESIYLALLVPVMAFISTAGAIRDDFKPGSADYLFTRPVRRTMFVLFKYLSQTACLQIDFLMALAVLIGVGMYRHVPGLFAALPVLFLAQFLLIMAFSAFGFLCGVITSRYVVVGLVYAAVVEVGIGHLPTQLSKIAMIRQVTGMIKPLMGRAVSEVPSFHTADAPGILATVGLLLGFAIVLTGLAALFFSHQELAGTKPQQS